LGRGFRHQLSGISAVIVRGLWPLPRLNRLKQAPTAAKAATAVTNVNKKGFLILGAAMGLQSRFQRCWQAARPLPGGVGACFFQRGRGN
jgi:hypothetical protein